MPNDKEYDELEPCHYCYYGTKNMEAQGLDAANKYKEAIPCNKCKNQSEWTKIKEGL